MKRSTLKAIILTATLALSSAAAWANSASATGQVTKIDADTAKVTIKHGPIKAMDMPDPMTMVYTVKDPADLKSIKAGDAVKFDLSHDASGYVITHIEKK